MEQLQINGGLIYRLKDGANCDEINVTMVDGSRADDMRAAGARRVLACFNACAGIDTDVLEVTHGLDAIYSDIIKQRDDLLAALKVSRGVLAEWNGCCTEDVAATFSCDDELSVIDAAIAKAEGRAE